MPRHAYLSASASHRWLSCPPSAKLCADVNDEASPYAKQGTDAHELCEYKVLHALGEDVKDPTENLDYFDTEMEESTDEYCNYVLEQYEKAKQVGFNDYEVAHESLLPDIERERDFVVNKLLNPNFKMPKTTTPHEKGWGMKALGCIGKGFLIYLCLVAFVQIKKCSKDSVKESYETPSTYATKESAESQLRSFVLEKNISLPQDMDENITTQEVILERDAIVYVYKVNDNFFAEFKDHAFSRDMQLKNLRTVYDKMKPMIDLLIETHRGIYYRYICRESGETTEFKIYYSDLVDLQ